VVLWVAQGFGTGRIRFAPGTWGSLVGLLWFAILLSTGSLWLFVAGLFLSALASVWICDAAERILKQSDPSSVVFDEIVAVPACFLVWVLALWLPQHHWPSVETFFSKSMWWSTAGVWVLFRVFDILKPWPVRQSQKLPGGWGVTVDDLLAAAYVNVICLLTLWGQSKLHP
jgi:phosphatidylglycerophosphatase A